MLISRIRMRPDAAGDEVFRKCTDDIYAIHAQVWDLFAGTPARNRDFLYRQEMGQGLPAFFCISEREPHDRQGIWAIETKPYAPVVRSGQVLSFVLCANPIRAKRDENHRQHRHDVVMEAKTRGRETMGACPGTAAIVQEAGCCWLAQKGVANGFSICTGQVRADGYRQLRIHKPGGDIRISTLNFTGLLTVTAPGPFLHALFTGIGPAKGFGCGMMMVRRT